MNDPKKMWYDGTSTLCVGGTGIAKVLRGKLSKSEMDENAERLAHGWNGQKPGPLNPSPGVLCRLASVVVHADELLSPNGHQFDHAALTSVLTDPEVILWIKDMTDIGMAPVKR